MTDPTDYPDIRDAVRKLAEQFPGAYWRQLDRQMAYPTAFVDTLTDPVPLPLIPRNYGGAGLTLTAAANTILEEIQRAGCNGAACPTRRCM